MGEITEDVLWYAVGAVAALPVCATILYGSGVLYSTAISTAQIIKGDSSSFGNLYRENFQKFISGEKKKNLENLSDSV